MLKMFSHSIHTVLVSTPSCTHWLFDEIRPKASIVHILKCIKKSFSIFFQNGGYDVFFSKSSFSNRLAALASSVTDF